MHSAIQMKSNLLIVALFLAVAGPAWADTAPPLYPAMAPIERYLSASPAVEIAMAKTAAPKSVSDNATVMVLTKTGYETAVKGSNGFVCYVGRSWEKDFNDPEFWNPHGRTPQCWNAAAASSTLPEIFKRTQWILAGVSKEEMAARTKAAWASHEFVPPAPESVAFMLSKDQYINDPVPGPTGAARWCPHIMFFVPATEDSKWGANMHGSPIFSTTSAVDPITTFFVVAPKWSDGSLGPYVAAPAAATGAAETHHH